LDPFQDEVEYKKFLVLLNEAVLMDSCAYPSDEIIEVKYESITIRSLIFLQLVSILFKKCYRIVITDPYPITEYFVDQFKDVKNFLTSDYWNPIPVTSTNSIEIAIHHRHGVGGKAVYPGQKISRELDLSYFINVLNQISKTLNKSHNLKISVFTDAPEKGVDFLPPKEQLHLWEGTPNFQAGRVAINGASISDFFLERGYEVEVLNGGSPLEAIHRMSQADYLVSARSSLSYVAGLLNQSGVVFEAPGFWHSTPSYWVRNAHEFQ
jgi:hypothetical protein